jgi:hypothetical protein
MENNIVLNNDNIYGPDFRTSKISGEKGVCEVLKQPLYKLIFSVFHYAGFAVKVIVLSAVSFTYFVIGGIGVLLYVIFYEKLYKTLLLSLEMEKQKDPYYYKLKNHHLELYYEA